MKRKSFGFDNAKRFIIDYEFCDDKIKVYSTNGEYRLIKKNKTNLNKIDHAIISNKIAIAKKIDNFEKTSQDRRIILLFNMLFLSLSGCAVVLSFFSGSMELFLGAILFFSVSVLTASTCGLSCYILASNVRRWKKLTGYKRGNEFELPNFSEFARLYVKREKKS